MSRPLRALLLTTLACIVALLVADPAIAQDGAQVAHRGGQELVPGVYLGELLAVVTYGLIGLALSILGYVVFEKVAPFPVRKEIEEDQNVALGIVIGSVILSIAIVVSSAIQG